MISKIKFKYVCIVRTIEVTVHNLTIHYPVLQCIKISIMIIIIPDCVNKKIYYLRTIIIHYLYN